MSNDNFNENENSNENPFEDEFQIISNDNRISVATDIRKQIIESINQ